MATSRRLSVRDGDVLLLVGTMKGLFLLRSAGSGRRTWEIGGPHFPGHGVYAAAFDPRNRRGRIWSSDHSFHFGAVLRYSDDFGRTWCAPEAIGLKFPEDAGLSLKQIWQIRPGRESEPEVLYCGVEPASLFVSRDGGESWSLVRGLHDHPHRPRWEPGGGGLGLHSIVVDPAVSRRLFVAISTGGVYRSDDDGESWHAKNRGIRADFLPDKQPEFGQCVHKMVPAAGHPGRFYLQNHGGIYRSDDGGDSWRDIGRGVPSDFGFPIAAHPRDGDSAYIVPLESDQFRCTPEGKLRVYRTGNAGRSWKPLVQGLPQRNALETVLRDAMAVDSLDPAGIYFGTRSGKIYGSRDDGRSWKMIWDGLPPVVCVRAIRVGEDRTRDRKAARSSVTSLRERLRARRRERAAGKAARPAARARSSSSGRPGRSRRRA